MKTWESWLPSNKVGCKYLQCYRALCLVCSSEGQQLWVRTARPQEAGREPWRFLLFKNLFFPETLGCCHGDQVRSWFSGRCWGTPWPSGSWTVAAGSPSIEPQPSRSWRFWKLFWDVSPFVQWINRSDHHHQVTMWSLLTNNSVLIKSSSREDFMPFCQ